MQTKDEVFSLRFRKNHAEAIRQAAKEQNISPTKAAENMIIHNIDVLNKCFMRQDLIVQRAEIKKLYSRFAKKELDIWVDEKYGSTVSCMKLFSPMLQFEEMTQTMSSWFKQNGHHLYFEDNDGIRTIVCSNSDMGYNWLYVHGMIYFKMFNEAKYPTSEFKSDHEDFSFKVIIPK
jgi:hypothetical protein